MKKVILATAIATLLVGCNSSSDENHQITEPKPEPEVPVINPDFIAGTNSIRVNDDRSVSYLIEGMQYENLGIDASINGNPVRAYLPTEEIEHARVHELLEPYVMVYDENNDVQETWYVDIILKNIVTGQDLKARYNADQTVELFNRRMQLQELFYSWDEFKEANQYLIAYADAKAMYNGFEYIGNYFYGSSKMDSTVEGVIETFVKFSPFMKESHGTEPIETPDEPTEPPTVIGKDQIFGSDLINANADGSVTVTVQGGEIDGFNQTKKPYPISVYTRNANIDAGTKLQDYTVDYEVKLFNEPSSSSFMNIYIIREGKLFEHDRIDVMREDQIIYNYHRDDDRDSERFFSWDDLISVHGNKTIAHRYSETHLGVGTFAGNFIIRSTGSSGAVAGDEYTFTQYDIEYQGD